MKKLSKYETIENTNNNELEKMYTNPSNELLTYLKEEKKRNNNGNVLPSFLGIIINILIIVGIILLVILYKGV